MSNLPQASGTLSINFQDDFLLEKSLHTTEQYVNLLKKQRAVTTDSHVCCFCGFPDRHFLEIHHANGDHTDYSQGNLKYICTLCHRLQHLGWVGVSNLGKIIYLPTLIDEPDERFWLEPLHHIQRFYLMRHFLSAEENERLKLMPLTKNIQGILTKLKAQDIDASYIDLKVERAIYLAERAELEKTDPKEKAEKVEEIKKRREGRQAEREQSKVGSDFADLHLLDLLEVLVDSGKKNEFLRQQDSGKHGRMAVWFNLSVFEPFEPNPDYTLSERLEYYEKTNLFSAHGLQQVMSNLRKQYMD